jgi:hypothetical protein
LYEEAKKKQLSDSNTDEHVKVMATFVKSNQSNDEILTHLHLPAVQFFIPKPG